MDCKALECTEDDGTGVLAKGFGVDAGGVEVLTDAAVGVVEGEVTACEVVEGVETSGCGVCVG